MGSDTLPKVVRNSIAEDWAKVLNDLDVAYLAGYEEYIQLGLVLIIS